MTRVRRLTAILPALFLAASVAPAGAMAIRPSDRAPDDPEFRIYVAMGTFHLRDFHDRVQNNWLIGVSWRRVYAATFINSFGDRSYTAGIQGSFIRGERGTTSAALGYRLGLVTGYDERLHPIARRLPILPLVQPLVTLQASRVGLEFSYSGVVASGSVFLQL